MRLERLSVLLDEDGLGVEQVDARLLVLAVLAVLLAVAHSPLVDALAALKLKVLRSY